MTQGWALIENCWLYRNFKKSAVAWLAWLLTLNVAILYYIGSFLWTCLKLYLQEMLQGQILHCILSDFLLCDNILPNNQSEPLHPCLWLMGKHKDLHRLSLQKLPMLSICLSRIASYPVVSVATHHTMPNHILHVHWTFCLQGMAIYLIKDQERLIYTSSTCIIMEMFGQQLSRFCKWPPISRD